MRNDVEPDRPQPDSLNTRPCGAPGRSSRWPFVSKKQKPVFAPDRGPDGASGGGSIWNSS